MAEKKYSKNKFMDLTGGKKFHKVMREFGRGTLKDSNGRRVTKHSQAVAIAASEQSRADKES